MIGKKYKCAHCNKVYIDGWSTQERNKESKEIFGKHPNQWRDKQVIVCDPCFKKMHPYKYPKLLELAKKILA